MGAFSKINGFTPNKINNILPAKVNDLNFSATSGFTLLNSQVGAAGNPCVLNDFDSTGADLIVVALTSYDISSVSDQLNTYTKAVDIGMGGGGAAIYYKASPDTSEPLDFSLGGATWYMVFAFSGCDTADALEDTSSNAYNVTTPGICTATKNGTLFVVAYNTANFDNNTSTATIDSSFTAASFVNHQGGTRYSSALAYKIQSTAGDENPVLSISAQDAAMACFNPA